MRQFAEGKYPTTQQSVSSLLITRAAQQPGRIAYTFLAGDGDEEQLTYAELDSRARAIGCRLTELGARDKRVALLYPPGIDYITALFGCLYAGAIAVPACPPGTPRPDRSLTRASGILRDSAPACMLTTSLLGGSLPSLLECPTLPHTRVLATDHMRGADARTWEPWPADPDSVALLQYTSGTTAAPKGVVLTHRNLIDNSKLIYRFFGHSDDSRGVLWLPPYNDMGLIGGIIQPLYGGFPTTLMRPEDFMRRPVRWLQEISRTSATTSGGPNFAYDLCVQKTTAEEREQLDLSSWQVAFNGAEPVRAQTMERFARAFAPAGFRPSAFHPYYGLAEASLIVTAGVSWSARDTKSLTLQPRPAGAPPRRVVSCGVAPPDHRLVVVDPTTRTRVPPGQVGEIWISGASVAQQYWRRGDETSEIFGARLADSGEGPFLRSEDLGFTLGNQLFVTGRMRDMIIMREARYYPADIELTAQLAAPVLRPGRGAAFTERTCGQERLVIAYEVRSTAATADVRSVAAAIRTAVAAEHGIRVQTVILLPPGTLPMTSNGKVRRRLCKAMFEHKQLPELGRSAADRQLETGRARRRLPAHTGPAVSVVPAPPVSVVSAPAVSVVSAPAVSLVSALGRTGPRWYRWLNGSRVPAVAYRDMAPSPAWPALDARPA